MLPDRAATARERYLRRLIPFARYGARFHVFVASGPGIDAVQRFRRTEPRPKGSGI